MDHKHEAHPEYHHYLAKNVFAVTMATLTAYTASVIFFVL